MALNYRPQFAFSSTTECIDIQTIKTKVIPQTQHSLNKYISQPQLWAEI